MLPYWFYYCSIDELLEDSDSEDESSKAKTGLKKSIPAWLRDDTDEITDFMDTSSSRNIVCE